MKKKIFNLFLLFLFCIFSIFPAYSAEKIKINNDEAGVWVFKIDTKKYGSKIKPFVTEKLTTPQKVYEDNCFDLVVNGGFYDVKNTKSVSYVIIDGVIVADPNLHTDLIESLKKEERLDKVLSRTELRILENKRHKLKFDIAHHTDPIKKGWNIKHSLQAGPMIYPSMDLVNEGFVIYEDGMVKSQSADILKRRERTAVALKGKYLYIVIFTKDHKVDAKELKDFIENNLKADKAMAFDGGISTAINCKGVSIGSIGKHQRKVKSFLIIER